MGTQWLSNPLSPRRFDPERRLAGKHIHKIAGPRPLYFSRFWCGAIRTLKCLEVKFISTKTQNGQCQSRNTHNNLPNKRYDSSWYGSNRSELKRPHDLDFTIAQ